MNIGEIWNLIAVQPIMNSLIVLSHFLFSNFGLAIIVFTFVIKAITYPFTLKQIKQTQAVQDIQPKLLELEKKYGKDRQRLAKEQMQLYRKMGLGAGCLVPLLVQMPIWFALLHAIGRALGVFPEDFLLLSRYLYPWPIVYSKLPLAKNFLWLDLAAQDKFFIMPLLVGSTMWIQQKMTTFETSDPQRRQQNNTMLWMMPIMFTVLTLSFPSGLALYWVVSNIVGIATQYLASGWGGMASLFNRGSAEMSPVGPTTPEIAAPQEVAPDEKAEDKQQARKRSPAKRLTSPRRQAGRGKSRRSKSR